MTGADHPRPLTDESREALVSRFEAESQEGWRVVGVAVTTVHAGSAQRCSRTWDTM